MQDLPGHIEVGLRVSEAFGWASHPSEVFALRPFPWPNSLGHFALGTLRTLLPDLVAAKLILSLAVLAFLWLIYETAYRLGLGLVRPTLAAVSVYDLNWGFGFFSFIVGRPIFLLWMLVALGVFRVPERIRPWLLALLQLPLFLAHGLWWCLAWLIAPLLLWRRHLSLFSMLPSVAVAFTLPWVYLVGTRSVPSDGGFRWRSPSALLRLFFHDLSGVHAGISDSLAYGFALGLGCLSLLAACPRLADFLRGLGRHYVRWRTIDCDARRAASSNEYRATDSHLSQPEAEQPLERSLRREALGRDGCNATSVPGEDSVNAERVEKAITLPKRVSGRWRPTGSFWFFGKSLLRPTEGDSPPRTREHVSKMPLERLQDARRMTLWIAGLVLLALYAILPFDIPNVEVISPRTLSTGFALLLLCVPGRAFTSGWDSGALPTAGVRPQRPTGGLAVSAALAFNVLHAGGYAAAQVEFDRKEMQAFSALLDAIPAASHVGIVNERERGAGALRYSLRYWPWLASLTKDVTFNHSFTYLATTYAYIPDANELAKRRVEGKVSCELLRKLEWIVFQSTRPMPPPELAECLGPAQSFDHWHLMRIR